MARPGPEDTGTRRGVLVPPADPATGQCRTDRRCSGGEHEGHSRSDRAVRLLTASSPTASFIVGPLETSMVTHAERLGHFITDAEPPVGSVIWRQ